MSSVQSDRGADWSGELGRRRKEADHSGHNREGSYWWARDAEGLRKCWISAE